MSNTPDNTEMSASLEAPRKYRFLEVNNLAKRFPAPDGNDLTIFQDINFGFNKGEFVCIIGHSGCGKSTILNTLAGLEQATDGDIVMNGKEIKGPSLERGVVFQNYSLLPWLSTLQNVTFAVRARWPGWSKKQVREHSEKYLNMVGLEHALQRKPSQLSGGMRQRVSIARAFATQPEMLLLDEPFGALDALTRGVIQDELIKIWEATHQTVFMITHDVDEALLLADRILLMSNGPNAKIAESVAVNLPRPRKRNTIFENRNYYRIRNYLVDFLVNRSEEPVTQFQTNGYPVEIDPSSHDAGAAKTGDTDNSPTSTTAASGQAMQPQYKAVHG